MSEPPVSPATKAQIAAAHRDDVVHDLPAPENRRFYPALDGLRALAVLMVFAGHYLNRAPLVGWGFTGVNIFFVLSGFLITGILYDTRDTAHRFRNFYVRRMLRIFPLYYAVLLLAFLLYPVFRWVYHPVWWLWPLYLTNFARIFYAQDALRLPYVVDHLLSSQSFQPPFALYFGHFWSLAIEEQFYLVWPLVVFLVRDRVRLRNLCLLSLPVCCLGRILCVLYLPHVLLAAGFLDRFTPFRVDSLLLGGFLALSLRGPEAIRVARLARPMMIALFAAFVLMEAWYLATTHRLYALYTGTWLVTIGFNLIDLFAASLLLRTIEPGTKSYRLLSHRRLRQLGQISYGFYIFHELPHIAYDYLGKHIMGKHLIGTCTALIALASTIAISYLSFRYFETPFLRLKDRFTA